MQHGNSCAASARRAACALALLAAAAPLAAWAQHAHTAAAPYAGLQSRAIKSLSEEDTQRLLQGQGMSLALAAELNGYPGPSHVLEHADALELAPEQRSRTESLLAAHKARARALGVQVVQAERALDRGFAEGRATPDDVARGTADIARLQGLLRAEHLQTHLQQVALLTPVQRTRYQHVRGYAAAATHQGEHR